MIKRRSSIDFLGTSVSKKSKNLRKIAMEEFIYISEVSDCRPEHLFRMNCVTYVFQEIC